MKHVNWLLSKTEHIKKYINSLLHQENVPPTYGIRNVRERYEFNMFRDASYTVTYNFPKVVSRTNQNYREFIYIMTPGYIDVIRM